MLPELSLSLFVACATILTSANAKEKELTLGYLQAHCADCHAAGAAEGDFSFEDLQSPSRRAGNLPTWERVFARVEAREMPPAGVDSPPDNVRAAFLNAVSERFRSERATAERRMNRTEYQNTVRDLLGVRTELAGYLPEDGQVQGFDKVANGLGLSAVLLERYFEAANAAMDDVILRTRPAPLETRRARLMEIRENQDSVEKNKGGVIEQNGAFVDFTPGWPPSRLDPAHPIDSGRYQCRVAVWPHEPNAHRTLAIGIYAGPLFGPGKRELVGIYDVRGTPEQPRVIEFETYLEAGHTLHLLPWVFPEHVTWRDKEEQRPGVAILWVETEGPLDQEFPSMATRRLFGENSSISMQEKGRIYSRHRKNLIEHYVESETPEEDIRRIVGEFARRAIRQPVSEELKSQFVNLALSRLADGNSFEEAVRAGVVSVLCSPHFLLLSTPEPENIESVANDHAGQLPRVDGYELASRLSYFLWLSTPDDELLRLASEGQLHDPAVRHAQVERLLQDPKSERFVKNFTAQWLDLRELEFTTPDKRLYPEYDELLLRSMQAETERFFAHMLTDNLSVKHFVDSDFAILNQRLASHYGIAGVVGHEDFRLVNLPLRHVRGGLLTQASILKVTANGTTTSPVIRGAWVLDKLLSRPTPPPPPGVPAVEPDVRGAKTIRQQLALHREHTACAQCHDRIDPPGFALEEFDVIGGHRDWYRSLRKQGNRLPKVQYYQGPDVELGGVLPSGQDFANFEHYQRLLLSDSESLAVSMAKKLLVYACGRPVGPAEYPSVCHVVQASQSSDFGLRTLVHEIVNSPLFLCP